MGAAAWAPVGRRGRVAVERGHGITVAANAANVPLRFRKSTGLLLLFLWRWKLINRPATGRHQLGVWGALSFLSRFYGERQPHCLSQAPLYDL